MSDVRGVLDANLLASGLVSPNGPGNALIAEARLGRFELVVSPHLLAEVREALMGAFHVDDQDAGELLAFVERISERVEPGDVPAICRDPDDDAVLALADQSGAAFLATYDHGVMAVGSVGSCGIIHPINALQLVAALNPSVKAEGIPGTTDEDRSKWKYEDGGAAFDAARAMVDWLLALPRDRQRGREMVTPESWPNFQRAIADGTAAELARLIGHWMPKVRYPAPGMAFVFCPRVHAEQAEPFMVERPQAMELTVITLVERRGRWLVHGMGPMVPPADLGLTAYSW
jgi:putative PIN family toxin of toxin-antitoxin system